MQSINEAGNQLCRYNLIASEQRKQYSGRPLDRVPNWYELRPLEVLDRLLFHGRAKKCAFWFEWKIFWLWWWKFCILFGSISLVEV